MSLLVLVFWMVCFITQVLVWWRLGSGLSGYASDCTESGRLPFVSIIVAARNESQNLQRHLPKILAQDYPHFEVLVVDDHSEDESLDILKQAANAHSHLHFHALSEGTGKKHALLFGIRKAKGPLLAFTDADCFPASTLWLRSMVMHASGSDVCLGYGPYLPSQGLLNRLIRFETWYVGMQYLSFAACKMPYMGVGRNLLYKKEVFLKSDRMASHLDLLSGDDDLFVASLAEGTQFAISLDPDSFTYSIPENTWTNFYQQKARHITTAERYPGNIRLWLIAIHTSHLGVYLSAFAIMIMSSFFVGTLLVVFRFICVYFFCNHYLRVLKEDNLRRHSWYLDGLLAAFYLVLSIRLFSQTKKWKH